MDCRSAQVDCVFCVSVSCVFDTEIEPARRAYALAAAQDNADAQCRLADMFYDGLGGRPDLTTARHLYEAAAAQGNTDAQTRLSLMCRVGQGGSIDINEAERLAALAVATHIYNSHS